MKFNVPLPGSIQSIKSIPWGERDFYRYFSGEICWGLSHATQIVILAALLRLEKHLKVYCFYL